jgi:hypothetical protein
VILAYCFEHLVVEVDLDFAAALEVATEPL